MKEHGLTRVDVSREKEQSKLVEGGRGLGEGREEEWSGWLTVTPSLKHYLVVGHKCILSTKSNTLWPQ